VQGFAWKRENVEATIPKLQTIRELGVEIAVDDFGTGYSSLAYIARVPIRALKVDRSFVVGMLQNQHSLAIVKAVISLAHALGLNVVAEGVEAEEQAAPLEQLECDEMQGFLISRPMPADEIAEFIARVTHHDLTQRQIADEHPRPRNTSSSGDGRLTVNS
jgi:EAL domain-containing protein (putative c-di-GMP-specific phosphodiesterase class I)